MKNLLFVLYHDFTANSATHVHNLATRLMADGWDCAVAVPLNKESVCRYGTPPYRVFTYGECLASRLRFADGRGPDLMHVWTPREIVRRFTESLLARERARLLIHLEDNEEAITKRALKSSGQPLPLDEDQRVPDHLSHPKLFRRFLRRADGVTVLMDRLTEFVPCGIPSCVFYPGIEPEVFHPCDPDRAEMQRLGVPLNSTVLCYTGNVTTANAGEVRSLYLAIGLLNRMGIPAVLVRAGTDYCDFLEGARSLIMANVIECGFVGRAAVAKLMAMADVLVQPGRPDPFNDYRFPSKLPEFFAMGKPVVLPATNIGLALKHMEQALVLPCVDAVAIVESVRLLRGNAGLRARLSAAGLQFATDRLRWEVSAAKLKAFYEETLTRPISVLATAADLTTSKYLSA